MIHAAIPSRKPCQGGFCSIRAGCPSYNAPSRAVDPEPADRLCKPGQDGVMKGPPQ